MKQIVRQAQGLAILVILGAAGCTDSDRAASDPYEAANRQVHAFNKAADRAVLRPVATAYGEVVPGPARQGITNLASNLSLPGSALNHALQGDASDATGTILRFGMNTLFGFGGLLDPAADAGLYARDTDFGETLARWGVREGAYVELPLLGPSSERDLAGRIVDAVIDPVGNALSGDAATANAALQVTNVVGLRYELRAIVDALLYESADSYAAQRIAYLQNKAAGISGGTSSDDLEDPYAFE
jgi:phospholipid-binding lipoprotein MlaA